MGFNAWNAFVPRKVGEIPGYGWTHLPRRENCMLPIAAANQTAWFSFSTANYSRKLHKKHLIRAVAHGIRQFHWALHHQIAECMWACPTPWEATMYDGRKWPGWQTLLWQQSQMSRIITQAMKLPVPPTGVEQKACYIGWLPYSWVFSSA